MQSTRLDPEKTKIRVRGLEFFYNNQRSLKSIDIDIPEKRITAIIGPSGCGKSTLLRVFNRIYSMYPKQEARGEVLLNGENILAPGYSMNRLRSHVGMVFQKPVPFPMAGNQPSFTANTRMSTIAATNAGIAAEIAVTTTVLVSSTPGRSPATSRNPAMEQRRWAAVLWAAAQAAAFCARQRQPPRVSRVARCFSRGSRRCSATTMPAV